MGFYTLETLRTLIKARRYPELRRALLETLPRGIRNAQADVLRGCVRLLVAADKEVRDIESEIGKVPAESVVKFRNGFVMPTCPSIGAESRDIDIAVVGRIESRKNQITILKAVESLGMKAVFVGYPNPNHAGYVARFRQLLDRSKSAYIPGVPSAEVAPILARAKVHVAASWFEVSSLVDIDAYVLGCRIVASQCGGTRELLGGDAWYVDPGSFEDIRQKIAAAVKSAVHGDENQIEQLRERLETWEQLSARLLDVYSTSILDAPVRGG